MIKFDYSASSIQCVSTPDNDLLTYPNSDWFRSIAMRVAGRMTGSNAQYIFSNNGSATGAINLALIPEGDSTAANRRKLALYINNAVTPRIGTTTFADGQDSVLFLQRETDVCTLYSCPVLATDPTDGSAVVTELSFAMTTSYNGSGGFYVASRSDMLAARLSDQAFGHLKAINRALTKLEMAKIAYGMRLVDLGYTPLLEVGMVNLSDVVDTGPNTFPFAVNGSPSAVAEPAFGFTPPIPVPAAIDVTSPLADRVIQRGFSVPLNGTYAGDAPATIEYRLYAPDGVTARTAWTPIPSATIADGNWSGAPTLPKGATDADRIAVRSKNSTGAVIVQSAVKSAQFFVGGLVATIGSSSAALLYASNSGTGFTAAGNVRKMSSSSFTWGTLGTAGAATLFANSLAQQSGMPIGMLAYGDSGTTLADWLGSGTMWTNFANAVAAAGGKLEAAYITVGSNDAATGSITSRAAHLANMRALVDRVRALTGQPDLPIMWSGSNRRPALSTTQSSYLRMAENDIGDYANVSHVQTIDFEVHTDNIHLSPNAGGFPASIARAAEVWGRRLYGDGVYARGPKSTAFTFSGDTVTATPQLRNGSASGLTPNSDFTGFTVTDSVGTPNALSRTLVDGKPTIKFDRALVAPVKVTHLSGGNPDVSALIYDNGATPLPMHVETDLAATDGAPPADVTAPIMSGSIAVSGVTQTGFTMSWGAATDNTGVDHYETSINGGSNWSSVGASLSRVVTGAAAGTSFQLRVRAHDSAGNQSNVLSATATTASASDTTAPVLTGQLAVSNITYNSADLVWPTASDNVGVVGYERSLDAGATWAAVGSLPTAALSGFAASTTYQVRVRAYDAAGNRSAALEKSFSTLAAPGNPDPEMSFTPSPSRTLTVSPTSKALTGGPWWNLAIPSKPRGAKDPQATLDVTLNWGPWLADIGNPAIAKFTATIFGVTKVGAYAEGALTTMVFSGGTGAEATITFEIETATTPPLKDERTVYIDLVNQ